jgi:hypothetical protein
MSRPDCLLFALPATCLTGLLGRYRGAAAGVGQLAEASDGRDATDTPPSRYAGLQAYCDKWDVANLQVMMPVALIGITQRPPLA